MLIRRRFRFYAAHRNLALNDKCARLHGHRYGVEVALEVQPNASGVGILFADIDAMLGPIFASFDHRTLLSHDDPLASSKAIDGAVVLPFATSAENLASYLLKLCAEACPCIVELALQETDSATVVARREDIDRWLNASE